MPNPPIDVARVHPGKHPIGSLLPIPVLLTFVFDANSSAVWCTTTSSPRPKPGVAKYEHDSTERILVPARDVGQRILCPLVRLKITFTYVSVPYLSFMVKGFSRVP